MRKKRQASFARILCPVDFSRHSRAALRAATALAARSGGQVTALYVSDPLLDAAAAASAYDVRWMKERSLKELQRLVARARLGVNVECMIAAGHADSTICAVAADRRADLIVMGSHGLSGPKKWLLGSVTDHVLRRSTVPVLVVPRKAAKALPSGWPGRTVLVAVDLVNYRASDVRALRDVLTMFDATPVFLHVMRPVAFPSWFRARRHGRPQDTSAQAALRTLARKVGVRGKCQLVFGDPADEIAATASSTHAGLVVLKLRRGSGLTGPHRGAITYRVAAQGRTPVLALPEAQGIRR